MITLSHVIQRFEADYLAQSVPLPGQLKALSAFKRCRTALAATFTAQCSNNDCNTLKVVPHSCGHRLCPHCQHHESQSWIERQRQQLVPGPYFLVTFTLPAQMRPMARANQRVVYDTLMDCAWQTLNQFAHNHRHLKGTPGAVAVLHTHSRKLDFHPHVHMALPAAALDERRRLWRRLPAKAGYLFNHEALAIVFRGKLLDALKAKGLQPPIELPEKWVVDCKRLDQGNSVMVYLGRYLYRGVIQERDILACNDNGVTYRWRDSKTKQLLTRTVSGAEFLRLLLQHVLPKGLRRVRSYGFLHPNAKGLAALLKLLIFKTPPPVPPATERATLRCACCGAPMRIVLTRTPPAKRAKSATATATATAPPTAARPIGAQA